MTWSPLFGAMAGVFYATYVDMQQLNKDKFRATVAAILFALGVVRGDDLSIRSENPPFLPCGPQ
jgi:hypothetical protein